MGNSQPPISPEEFAQGANDFFTGKYNDKINDALAPKCSTTNQGGTMDDIRDQIKNINTTTKSILQ